MASGDVLTSKIRKSINDCSVDEHSLDFHPKIVNKSLCQKSGLDFFLRKVNIYVYHIELGFLTWSKIRSTCTGSDVTGLVIFLLPYGL